MNDFPELQLLPMIKFFFNTLIRQTLIASLLKYLSDFTADVFFRPRRGFYAEHIY